MLLHLFHGFGILLLPTHTRTLLRSRIRAFTLFSLHGCYAFDSGLDAGFYYGSGSPFVRGLHTTAVADVYHLVRTFGVGWVLVCL